MSTSKQPSPVQIMVIINNWQICNTSNIRVASQQMMQEVHVKWNAGLSWQEQHSTRRRLFSPK